MMIGEEVSTLPVCPSGSGRIICIGRISCFLWLFLPSRWRYPLARNLRDTHFETSLWRTYDGIAPDLDGPAPTLLAGVRCPPNGARERGTLRVSIGRGLSARRPP